MKKLILIIVATFLVKNGYSQFMYLEGSDSLLITKINEYRESKNTEETTFSTSQNDQLIKKLEWMAGQNMVSHSDPWNTMLGTSQKLAKESSNTDTLVRYSHSGECLSLTYIDVPFQDTLNAEKYIQSKINLIVEEAVNSWKESKSHEEILRNTVYSGYTNKTAVGIGTIIIDLKNLPGINYKTKVRSYSVYSIYIVHTGYKEKRRKNYSYLYKD